MIVAEYAHIFERLFIHDVSNCVLLVFIRRMCRVLVGVG